MSFCPQPLARRGIPSHAPNEEASGRHIGLRVTHREQLGLDFRGREIGEEISRNSESIQEPLLFLGNADDEVSIGELLQLDA